MEIRDKNIPDNISIIIKRIENIIKNHINNKHMILMSPHIIDLHQGIYISIYISIFLLRINIITFIDGYISKHVDSVKFSGGIIAGLSIMSSRILSLGVCLSISIYLYIYLYIYIFIDAYIHQYIYLCLSYIHL
jgi:hypothetical protein